MDRVKATALRVLAKLWDRFPAAWRRRVLFAANDHFLIGVVGLLTDDRRRVLLLEHRFRTPCRWGLPGGFIARGESIANALSRELQEEVGLPIVVDPEPVDWELNEEGGYMSLTLTGRVLAPPETLDIRSPEIVSGGFYGRDELPADLYPYHRALVLAHLSE